MVERSLGRAVVRRAPTCLQTVCGMLLRPLRPLGAQCGGGVLGFLGCVTRFRKDHERSDVRSKGGGVFWVFCLFNGAGDLSVSCMLDSGFCTG